MEQETAPHSAGLWTQRIANGATVVMRWLSRHWLIVANLALGLFIGLPLLAPVLMEAGHERLAGAIHTLFYITCHQLPERSYFLFGPSWIYSRAELLTQVGEGIPLRFVGNELVGYKMATCQRCAAVYGGWLAWGLLFGLVRDRLRPLPVRGFVALLAPMAIDGVGQLLGLWDSSWITRTITGLLFGLAVVWLTYPYIERGMRDMQREAEDLLAAGRRA